MNKILIVAFIAVFFLLATLCSCKIEESDSNSHPWHLGQRPVPGPLPPDPGQPAPELDIQCDVVYGTVAGEELKLDFFKPAFCRSQQVPIAIHIHGGGWSGGDKEGVENEPEAISLFQLGFAVASINYRLAPAHVFPAQIEDCKRAVRFLRAHASDFGIDPGRVGLWGDSAGGHLVMLLGAAPDTTGLEGAGYENVSSRVQAVVDHYGVTDFNIRLYIENSTISRLLDCPDSWCPDKAAFYSPVTHVSPDDPPMLLIHGELDSVVPYDQVVLMARALQQAQVPGALIRVMDANHGFFPWPPATSIEPSRLRISFLGVAQFVRFLEPGALGDLDLDGHIDDRDETELLSLVGSVGFGAGDAPAPLSWNPLADLNADNRIDTADLALFHNIRPYIR